MRERCFMTALRSGGLATALIIALMGSAAAAASTPSLGVLLARHHAALGDLDAVNARWSGVIDQGGIQGRYTLVADRGGRYRLTLTLPLSTRAEGDDGTTGWRQDENGNVELTPSASLRSVGARLFGFNALIDSPSFRGQIVRQAIVGGKSVYALASTLHRAPLTIYVDAATYLVDGVDLSDRTIRYTAYRRFGRVTVPSQVVETQNSATTTTSIDALAVDVPTRGAYAPPQSRVPTFPASRTEVLVDYDPVAGLIVVPCQLDGKPARFLIDSGSTSSIIDVAAAKRLGLQTAGSARVEGAAVLTGTAARVETLDVSGIVLKPFVMEAVPLNLPGPIARNHIDGVLGYDFLAQMVVRISGERAQIRFIQATSFSYKGTGSVLAMDEADRVPRIQATIGNNDKATLQVDTGSDASLVLFQDFADNHAVDFADMADMGQDYARGAGGAFPIRLKTLTRLNIGAFSLADLVAQIVVHPTGAFSPLRADGIIGMGALGKFAAVFLDYPGKRAIFER